METTPAFATEFPETIARLSESDEGRLWAESMVKLVNQQREQLENQQQQIEILTEELRKLKQRNSSNSSVPQSQDLLKKPSSKPKDKAKKKRGPKYDHPGSTRNGFGQPHKIETISLDACPSCGGDVRLVQSGRQQVQQLAELIEQPIEIREYHRPKHQCLCCGWSGYADLPWGVKAGFSYGTRLSRVVGWLGYGGNLTWRKQAYVVEHILGVPISQGSLAKMHKWFAESLEPSYEQWRVMVQQPGVRCVDETTYCIDGIKHWLWVATSDRACVLLLAPTRSSAELKQLLGENFEGILSSDCFSGYNPQAAAAKQKCLTHLERDLKALTTSRFRGNREFAEQVEMILRQARSVYQDYHDQKLSIEQLSQKRPELEAQLQTVLDTSSVGGWPADAQRLRQRLNKYWSEWFTFLSHSEVKPDNNDAERALRPVVVHRKVSGGARSNWGAHLVAQMFSFLETVRLQGGNAAAKLFELLATAGRSPPGLQST